MKKIHLFILLCFSLLFSCTHSDASKTKKKILSLANCTITLPENSDLQPRKKMELYTISSEGSAVINVFNFGKKPVTITGNIKRWESQLDTVFLTKKESLSKGLVTSCEIIGKKNNVEKSIYACIIPTEDGPYYLKSEDLSNNNTTKQIFYEIIHSIEYNY